MKWLSLLVELLLVLGNNMPPGSTSSDVASERKRRREYEDWHKKHGSKWDKKS